MAEDFALLKDRIEAWRADPVRFVREALDVVPEPWQEEALRAVVVHPRIAVRSGNGVGKSAFLSWLVLWFLATRSPAKVPCTAPSAHQLFDVLWSEIAVWHRRMPELLRDQFAVKADRVELVSAPLDSFAAARTSRREQPDALQGFHSPNLLFLADEASGVDDEIFAVAHGSLSTPGAVLVLTGNPLRPEGFFWRAFRPHSGFRVFHVPCHASSRVSPAFFDTMRRSFGEGSEQWRVRVLGEFPGTASDSLIDAAAVDAAVKRDVVVPPIGAVWGLDVARFGSASSSLCKRFPRGVIEPPRVWNGLSTMDLCGRILNEWSNTPERERPSAIFVDAIGVGGGVADRLFELGLPAVGVNVGESPAFADLNCHRLRDELWFSAARWLERGDVKLPGDARLIEELICVRKKYSSAGKLMAESKADLTARGLPSPDVADGFCLTFAFQRVEAGIAVSGRWGASDWTKPLTRGGSYV